MADDSESFSLQLICSCRACVVGSIAIAISDDAFWSVSSHTYDSEDVHGCGGGVLLIHLGRHTLFLSDHSSSATVMSAVTMTSTDQPILIVGRSSHTVCIENNWCTGKNGLSSMLPVST